MTIDGKDERFNYWDDEVNDLQRRNADCVGMLIPKLSLKDNNGTYKIDTILYGENCSLCCKDKFYYEPVIRGGVGTCFAVEVGEGNLIVTARHVIDVAIELGYVKSITDFIRDYCVVFGFIKGKSIAQFPLKDIYYLNGVHNDTYNKLRRYPENDFTIFKVDRKITNKVLLNITTKDLKLNTDIYIVGHPLKMLSKITMGGKIKELEGRLRYSQFPNQQLFTIYSDVFLYDSGSPIFDMISNEILGMLISNGNQGDFVNAHCPCKRIARDYLKMERGSTCNFILRIDAIRAYI